MTASLVTALRRTAGVDERQLRLLGTAEQLEETGAPRLARLGAGLGGAFIAGAILWAAVTPVTETAPSQGQVTPAGAVRIVQHLEGGILAELLVREGDRVAEGQAIARLAEAGSRAELDQLKVHEAGLALKAERLAAFAESRKASFGATGVRYPMMAADQLAILREARELRDQQRQVLKLTMTEREAELKVLQRQIDGLQQQIALAAKNAELREGLVEKGLSSRLALLDVKREVARLRGELAAAQGNAGRARDQIATARQRLRELEARLASDALNEMGGVNAELAQVREQLRKQADRVDRLLITAPVAGIVKSLRIKTENGVIAPGSAVAEIVPLGEELIAETRILPKDVGNLTPGQPAFVKVTAFDSTRFGGLEGELVGVSASTFDDGDGKPYYKAVIRLPRGYVGHDPNRNLVLPGMTVSADIRTGSRTVLEYLAKPVKNALAGAMGER